MMVKRVGPAIGASAKTTAPRTMALPGGNAAVDKAKLSPSRVDRLVQIIDHCSAAKELADRMDEPFLAYMLAMTIQETRTRLRGQR